MARTKQTARKSTGGKFAPPPPPPQSAQAQYGLTEAFSLKEDESAGTSTKQPVLNDILSPSLLLKQKKKLKNSSLRPVELEKKQFLEGVGKHHHLKLNVAIDYMKTTSMSVDVTALSLSGLEQVTDMFLHEMMVKKIQMPRLTRISLCGCHFLTDTGIEYLTKTFQSVKQVELAGIPQLTEVSLCAIINQWQGTIEQINMNATNVGLIPTGYEGSIKLNGCPLLSPPEKLEKELSMHMAAKRNRPSFAYTNYKMVILPDDQLPWSPLSVMLREENNKATKKLRIKSNCQLDKSNQCNIFEAPVESGFSKLIVSEGCIVVMPYHLSSDGPDPDYAALIGQNLCVAFAECPSACFVLMGITEDSGSSIESVAKQYLDSIKAEVLKRNHALGSEVHSDKISQIPSFCANHQFVKVNGQIYFDAHPEEHLISTVLRVSSDNTQAVSTFLGKAIAQLHELHPALFLNYQEEVSDAILEIEKRRFPLSTLQKIDEELVPKAHVQSKFTNVQNTHKFMGKLCSIMARMGKMLYYPELDGSPAMSNFSLLETAYKKFTDPEQAPRKATFRYLGSSVPAWTMKDMEQICPDKSMLPLLVQLLEDSGILLCLPRDHWTTELGEETDAYIPYSRLPYYPKVDLEDYWPVFGSVPNLVQRDRYFTILPGISKTFFCGIIRSCVSLGGVRLLWNNGVILQKGPVVVLLEMLYNSNKIPVMYLGVQTSGSDDDIHLEITSALWSTLEIYRWLIRDHVTQAKLYCNENVMCPTCLPDYNRYLAVNSPSSVVTFSRTFLVGRRLRRTAVNCRKDQSLLDIDRILGQISVPGINRIVPSHNYLGCLPSFSAFSRCMFCRNCTVEGARCPDNLKNGNTSWHCSCNRAGQMCDKCGMCQRCISLLAQMEMRVRPQFVDQGSNVSLHDPGSYKLSQEVSPSYCPELQIHFIRGSSVTVEMKIGSSYLRYNTEAGSIEEVNKSHEHIAEAKKFFSLQDDAWICKEGFTVTVKLQFSKEDEDDMNVVFLHQGRMIYTHTCTAQACVVVLHAPFPLSMAVYTPWYKIVDEGKVDDLGEKAVCSYVSNNGGVHSSVEATIMQGKTFIENALFQQGGVNFSGSTYLTLPRNFDMTVIRYPSPIHLRTVANYPLCYTRSKISDALIFAGSQGVPETWSVYRMIHLLDKAGLSLDDDRQKALEEATGALLWAWHFIFKMLPKITLPKCCTELLPAELLTADNITKVENGLHDLVDLGFWRLLPTSDTSTIMNLFEEVTKLDSQAEAWQDITEEFLDSSGLIRVASKYNEENILYLCEGHQASVSFTEGTVEVLPQIYGKYSLFLLSVDLPGNQLTEFPEQAFHALPNLAELDCSNNFLEVLPDSIGCCKGLYSLTLPENNLTDLPASLENCKGLHRVDISSNMMDRIPAVVMKLTQLKRLYASNMFMTDLPENIGDLVNLEKLYINSNCFTSLPKSFGKLKMLNDLSMSGVPWLTFSARTKVVSYANFIKKLQAWKLDRWMEEHEEDVRTMFKLFDADSNELLDLKELGQLNAALFNIFPRFGYKGDDPPDEDTPSGFPPEILECTNLEYLNLFYQGFVSLPPEISNLQELKFLNVSHNPHLLTIPAEISTISGLTRLELDSCPLLKTPPKEIQVKGFSTVFAYLKRLMSGSVHCKRTKLMMVGLGGAGKTSLVNALLSKDGAANLTHGEAITDGIDISTWTVRSGEEQITYSVWDFAGQTVYYNTHQFFLSNRAVYLLLWNVRLGFEHSGLDFWLSSIAVQAPKAPIFVVGSHIDQVSKYEVPMNEMRARYKQIAGFHFVSSYTGQGIKDLQDNLFDVTLQQDYMGEQIPEVWLTFENNVINSRSGHSVVDYSRLENWANVSGIFDKTEILQSVQFLHELGSLQHFTTESLKSKVVINPQWIVDVMACVVSVKNSPIKDGRLHHSAIAKVWADYDEKLHDWLLKLTEAYDLTFPLDNEPVNLVPCLLTEVKPEFTWPEMEKNSDIKENKMIYKFDYLPAGLFNRAQVRLHQLSDSAIIWKRGSLLKKNGHQALLQQTRESELSVVVQGPRPENVIFLVHEVFEGLISESFRGVTYDFLIPCPDCLKLVLKDPHMFASSTVRRALELKAPFLQCIKYFHTISCVDLLACMPPDSHTDFDIHLVQSVRTLGDLRKDLVADVFMSYCPKDAPDSRSGLIHPATVCEELQTLGYKCWFPKPGVAHSMDEMAKAMNDAAVFVSFISNDYVKDENCVNIFKYARLVLRKPHIVVAVGENFDWRQSKLGILLADEVFINMTIAKLSVYPAKFSELKTALASRTNNKIDSDPTPSCFFSYTWVNSAKAVKLGTKVVPGAVGYGDPREIKAYLEENGVKCWIDVERVGQNGLFDDIAEGLLNARVVVVCVSDEYATSPTCQIEFRYACNTLQLPIILAVVGSGNKWRASEVGGLSVNFPLVSFQHKSEAAYADLLALVQERMKSIGTETDKDKKNRQNEKHKDLSFQELFELAQRKLLRQLCFYSEHQDVEVYPRLFVIDFVKSKEIEGPSITDEEKSDAGKDDSTPQKRALSRMRSVDERGFSKKLSELKVAFRVQRYCVYTLCEHDEGWHSVCDPIPLPHEFGETLLDKFSPFLARVTAVMKYNKNFLFHCMEEELGDDYVKWLEENPQATVSDYQQIYHDFRQMVIDADPDRNMGRLARCRLPNGKTIWLCERHRQAMKVTVLSSEVGTGQTQSSKSGGAEEYLINGLRSSDHKMFEAKFTSAKMAKRKKESVEGATKVDHTPVMSKPSPSKVKSKEKQTQDKTGSGEVQKPARKAEDEAPAKHQQSTDQEGKDDTREPARKVVNEELVVQKQSQISYQDDKGAKPMAEMISNVKSGDKKAIGDMAGKEKVNAMEEFPKKAAASTGEDLKTSQSVQAPQKKRKSIPPREDGRAERTQARADADVAKKEDLSQYKFTKSKTFVGGPRRDSEQSRMSKLLRPSSSRSMRPGSESGHQKSKACSLM